MLHPPEKKVITNHKGPFRLGTGEHVSNEIDMAEILNEYFVSVLPREDTNGIIEASPGPTHTVHLNQCDFTEKKHHKDSGKYQREQDSWT